jgi:chemotaxis protein CheD
MFKPVDAADFSVGFASQDVLVVYPVLAGMAVAAYDHASRVGGLLHFTQPDSAEEPDKAAQRPAMFADTGLPAFLWELFKQGATRKNLTLKLAGAAVMLPGKVGANKKNALAAKRVLWKHNLVVSGECVGGNTGIRLSLDLASGMVLVKNSKGEQVL